MKIWLSNIHFKTSSWVSGSQTAIHLILQIRTELAHSQTNLIIHSGYLSFNGKIDVQQQERCDIWSTCHLIRWFYFRLFTDGKSGGKKPLVKTYISPWERAMGISPEDKSQLTIDLLSYSPKADFPHYKSFNR